MGVYEFGFDDVLIQFGEQGIAFRFGHANQPRGVGFVDEEPLALGHRVGPYDRGFNVRHRLQLFFGRHVLLDHAAAARELFFLRLRVLVAIVAVAVHVLQPPQARFQVFRQCLVRGSGAGEAGVAQHPAVFGRDFQCIKRRQHAGLMFVGKVAVPEAAGILRADGFAVLVEHVGDDENFRMSRQAAFLAHVLFQDSETPRESDLLCRRDLLVAEKRHFVVEECVGDVRKCIVVQGLRQVDA